MDREDVKALVRRWWDVYADENLDYSDHSAAAVDDRLRQPLLAAPSEAGGMHCIAAPSAA